MKTVSDFLAAYSRIIAAREVEAKEQRLCKPPIVISREFGSGGYAIAEKLAQRLGFALWDKAILDQIATQAKVPANFLTMLDERPADALELLGASLLHGVSLTPEDYARLLKASIRAVLRLGSAVIVGRGAIFLAEPGKAFRLRVVAPLPLRIRNVANRYQISEEEAAKRIEKLDKERRQFLLRYFGTEEATADCFDLALNTECLGHDDCVELALSAYERVCKCKVH